MIIALALLVAVSGVVAGEFGGNQDEIQEEFKKAQAYCYQAYGDSGIVNSKVVGGHGGFHCAANDDDPHLHDVTERAKMAAYYANESNRTVDQWPNDRYQPRHDRGYFSFLNVGGVLLLLSAIGIVAFMLRAGRGGE